MKPRLHQEDGALWALFTIREYGLAYLIWKERTGKTLTALLTAEQSKAKSCLIVTKKKAISGWLDTLYKWKHRTKFEVINYESVHKITKSYDFIILDEAHHAISGIGRPSKTWKAVKKHTKGKPILYLSATPYAEHLGLIYHQLALSDWTPLKHRNFYDFYRKYGVPNMVRTPYGLIDQRNQYKDQEILDKVSHLFDFKTRADVGIEVEPVVRLVKVSMSSHTRKLMTRWVTDGVVQVKGREILADSDMKKRIVHYQMEGGTIKLDEGYIVLPTIEKIQYIKDHYDTSRIAIMAHFIAERELLRKALPNVTILSSDGDAEGVDLSYIEKLIIYSMSFKTSKHTQRVARQANHNRSLPIIVDVLAMSKPGIGEAVYNTVAVKELNFIKNSYESSI